jgi:DNA ligase D-like protein (predicted ligase)
MARARDSGKSKILTSLPKQTARFIEPMECLPVSKLPEDERWAWEIKLDGYRALAIKAAGEVSLVSRRNKSMNAKFRPIAEALTALPDGTVVDGELVALDDNGHPNFNLLQNFRGATSHIYYYIFDLLICKNRNLTHLALIERRALLNELIVIDDDRITSIGYIEAQSSDLLKSVREHKLEGIVGKRKDSLYEPGLRSGAWIKYRVNAGQEFVIGGYIPGPHGLDLILVGYYKGKELVYVAKVRNGFVPASRRKVFEKLRPLVTPKCPFVNLPETHRSRWGEGLTAEGMKECVWVRPELVAQIEFLEWTEGIT